MRPLDLDIESGELVVLLGPSGCGKTTLLRMLAGLVEPSAGEIVFGDKVVNDMEPAARDVAMVFQNYALYPHMSVRANLGFGLRMRRITGAALDDKVRWAASLLGLEGLLDRKPGQLSGGQRQRVALGRAIVREPKIFLFDEPLSNLDARLRLEMREEIAALHRRLGATMVFVTHDQVEAMTLGQRVAVLNDGSLQQFDVPLDVYNAPANLFVASFVGTPGINTIEGTIAGAGAHAAFGRDSFSLLLPGVDFAGNATLGVRPEGLRLSKSQSDDPSPVFLAQVTRMDVLGNEVLIHFPGPGATPWVARADSNTPLREGDSVAVHIDTHRAHLFAGSDMKRIERMEQRP